jgi:hypothetical protein
MSSNPISLYYPENNQRIILYPNGYGISRIQNTFSHGIEIQILKWKRRDPSKWERLLDRLRSLTSHPVKEPFYYSAEFVRGNILQLPSFFGDDQKSHAEYAYLKPEDENQVKTKVQELN